MWLGCPQQLCIINTIDKGFQLSNGSFYVVRGNYYWNLDGNQTVTVNNAKLIGDATKNTQNSSKEFASLTRVSTDQSLNYLTNLSLQDLVSFIFSLQTSKSLEKLLFSIKISC